MLFTIGNSPANENGSIVVDVATNGTITFQHVLQEQGAGVVVLDDGINILIPGIDPTESWDFGNVYVNGTKKRTLTNVIHSFGACLHNGFLFVATGVHLGDETTFRGYVFRSNDLGDTWDAPVQVSNYRVYDIVSFNGLLYVIANNFQDPFVAVSDDDGETWDVVNGVIPEALSKMVVWANLLVILSHDGQVATVDISGNVNNYDPPTYMEPINTSWNVFAVSGTYLYTICNDRLYRTNNLTSWEYYCDLGRPCTGLSVWTGFGIIVSEIGTDARLLKIPIT